MIGKWGNAPIDDSSQVMLGALLPTNMTPNPAFGKVNKQTVSGAATNKITFTGLDLDTDSCYMIHFVLKAVGSSVLTMMLNNRTGASYYSDQWVNWDAGAHTGNRQTESLARVATCTNGVTSEGILFLSKLTGQRPTYIGHINQALNNAMILKVIGGSTYTSHPAPTENVTQIDLYTAAGNHIGVGSSAILTKHVV